MLHEWLARQASAYTASVFAASDSAGSGRLFVMKMPRDGGDQGGVEFARLEYVR